MARAGALSSEASLERAGASVEQAKADVANAKAAVERADAEQAYASNNLHRIEPLLAKQFVTVDQVDQARTLEVSRSQASHQARSQLALAEAGLAAAEAQYKEGQATVVESHQQVQQATHNVTTLEPLIGELPEGRPRSIPRSTTLTTAGSSPHSVLASPTSPFRKVPMQRPDSTSLL